MTRPNEPDAGDASPETSFHKDDPLLRELAAWARDRAATEREQLDGRWDRLAAGALTPEEEAALRAEAEGSPVGAAALVAFQPLGAVAEARIVARISAQREVDRPTDRTARSEPASSAVDRPPASRSGAVLPFRRRFAVWGGGLGLAAAAALVALLVLPGNSVPLPSYTAELLSGDRTDRSAAGTEPSSRRTFSNGARFELVLRPATAEVGEVALRCFLIPSEGGAPRAFPACDRAVTSGDGSLRVIGTVGTEIDFLPGDWTLWALIARPGELPADPPVSGAAAPIAGDRWLAIPVAIRFAAAV